MTASTKKGTPITPEQLRSRLLGERAAGKTRYGGDGERIFAECLRDLGHTVHGVHAGGVDFLVDDVVRVDVKTQLALNGKVGPIVYRPVPLKERQSNVHYAYVVFFPDFVRLFECPRGAEGESQIDLSWDAACSLLSRTRQKANIEIADPDGVRVAQRATCAELRDWIATYWGLRAKVSFRGNPIAQENMAGRAWGPESFYQNPAKQSGKTDLVVLVYYSGIAAGVTLAYPLSHSREISWTDKPVGPNSSRRKTFDPAQLDGKFVFADIPRFKREFLSRFL